jgi:hypothetical protein
MSEKRKLRLEGPLRREPLPPEVARIFNELEAKLIEIKEPPLVTDREQNIYRNMKAIIDRDRKLFSDVLKELREQYGIQLQ